MNTNEKVTVQQHQHKDWTAGRKWVCKCSECKKERKQQREQDKLLVRGVDYKVGT
jgi:hypothetical protein